MRTPFQAHLNGMPDFGQGFVGKRGGWLEKQWERADLERVRLTDLIATNLDDYLDKRLVERYVKRPEGGDPCVISHRGKLYVADGHHRAVAAYLRGERFIRARIMKV